MVDMVMIYGKYMVMLRSMVRYAPDLLLILGGSMSLSSAEQLPATRHAHTPGVPA